MSSVDFNNDRPQQNQKLYALEGLRFLLSVAVVAWHYYHYGPLTGKIKHPATEGVIFSLLCFSVEAFFIISGLVISFSIKNKGAKAFATQRLLRLAPSLMICSTITMITYIAADIVLGQNNVTPSLITKYAATFTTIPLLFMNGIDYSLWSLKYELRFYALVAFFILISKIKPKDFALKLSIILIAADVILLISELIIPNNINSMRAIRYLGGGGYGTYFAMGMLIYSWQSGANRNTPLILFAFIVCIVLGSYRAWGEANKISAMVQGSAVEPAVGLAIVLICLSLVFICAQPIKIGFMKDTITTLGAMSYPLYLIHQNAGYNIIEIIHFVDPSFGDPRVLLIAIMLAASYVIAKHAEPYIHNLLTRLLKSKPSKNEA